MSLEEYRRDLEMCCRCSLCKFIPLEKLTDARYANACPSIARYNFNAYSGGGRLNVGLALLDGRVQPSPQVAEIAYRCLMCGACDVSCKYAMDMEVMEPLRELRAACVEAGQTSVPVDQLVGRMRTHSVMYGAAGAGRLSAEELGVKDCTRDTAEVLLHLGCQTASDEALRPAAASTAALLVRAGVDVGVLGEAEVCCGGRALEFGYEDDFRAQAERCMAAIEKSGARLLVTSCAHCFYAFTVQYRQAGLKPPVEVMHSSQFLWQLVETARLEPAPGTTSRPTKVTYHDPCHIGRLGEPFTEWSGTAVPGHRRLFEPAKPWRRGTNGGYDAPRSLLASVPGLELVEMNRVKEYAWCCGAGGGVPESDQDFAAWTAQQRLAEAEETGAQVLVTACPGCRSNLARAAGAAGSSMRVVDVAELLAGD